MATVAETKQRAGEFLGVVGVGGTLSAPADARLQQAYDEEYADLKDDGLAIWASTGTVPNDVMPHLAALMAYNAADSFGVSGERFNRIVVRRNAAPAKIRSAVTPAYESFDDPKDY